MENRNSAMPYSPSPRPGQTGTGSLNHILRHSATPPLPPQALSKQKKRRNALVERLEEISSNFALHRDDYYRKQLQTLQFDINYINRAQPYENAPLNDLHSDIFNEMISSLTANTGEAHRASSGGSRMPDMEVPPRAGIWASKYTQEINDAMEERDVQLTLVAERHNAAVDSLKAEFEYDLQVAEEERKIFREQIRERVIQQVQQRRTALLREKNAFQNDTNSLHINHTGYNVGTSASPGGPQSNRKTRNTRQKLEVEELGTAAEGNKRKRKALAEADNGSPGPPGRAALVDVPPTWKELEPHRIGTPPMSIEQLFSEKELLINLQNASHAAIESIAKRRKASHGIPDSGTFSNGEASDAEDNAADTSPTPTKNNGHPPEAELEDAFAAATEMDRAANSSSYATRSTRIVGLSITLADFSLPSDLAGRAAVIPLLPQFAGDRFRKEEEPHRTTSLNDQEKEADLAMIRAAIKERDKNPAGVSRMNRKVLDDLCPPITDYISTAVSGRGSDDFIYSSLRTEIVSRPPQPPDEARRLKEPGDG